MTSENNLTSCNNNDPTYTDLQKGSKKLVKFLNTYAWMHMDTHSK